MKHKEKFQNSFDTIKVFFVFYMILLYSLDLLSTYLALSVGAVEGNPALRYLLSTGDAGYLLAFIFMMSLVFLFFLFAEFICIVLRRYYNPEVVYISVYSSVMSVFTIIQVANILGNLFIWVLA